jgi:DNA-binding IscR family transcriptional regulator
MEAVEGPMTIVPCQGEEGGDPCAMAENCSQVDVWERIRHRMLQVFDEYTLDGVKSRGFGSRALPILG